MRDFGRGLGVGAEGARLIDYIDDADDIDDPRTEGRRRSVRHVSQAPDGSRKSCAGRSGFGIRHSRRNSVRGSAALVSGNRPFHAANPETRIPKSVTGSPSGRFRERPRDRRRRFGERRRKGKDRGAHTIASP